MSKKHKKKAVATATPEPGTQTTEQPGAEGEETPPETKGTSEELFPEFFEEAQPEGGEPQEPGEHQPPEAIAEGAEAEPTDYLDPESVKGKLVKVKINGVESEIPYEDLVKGYQTDQHLSQKGQRLAEREKSLQQVPTPPAAPAEPAKGKTEEEDAFADEYVNPHLNKRLDPIEEKLGQLVQVLDPMLQAHIKREKKTVLAGVDEKMKAQGLTDFKQSIPKIEAHLITLPVEEQAQMNNPLGFENIYLGMKHQELQKGDPLPNVPKPKPKIVKVVSGSAIPSTTEDGEAAKRQVNFDKAKETGSLKDWGKVLS